MLKPEKNTTQVLASRANNMTAKSHKKNMTNILGPLQTTSRIDRCNHTLSCLSSMNIISRQDKSVLI